MTSILRVPSPRFLLAGVGALLVIHGEVIADGTTALILSIS
ncbi:MULTISPECIES: hypothetical protein [unclassified Streptomyces]